MKKVFITGISGFVGSHLAELLRDRGDYDVYGTVFGSGNVIEGIDPSHLLPLNLLEKDTVAHVVETIQPAWVFHLAALTSPAISLSEPGKTISNNVEAQVNVFEALKGKDWVERVLVVGSAEEYGRVRPEDVPIDELIPLRPMNPYAVSKIAQDFLGLQYFQTYHLPVVRVRPFNHTGERQTPLFVVPAFAEQIAKIEKGLQEPVVKVGNLEAIRDFTYVKDMAAAYLLVMQKGNLGDVYNLGSGVGHAISEVLHRLLDLTDVEIRVEQDPQRMTPSDVPKLVCQADKFVQLTGWKIEVGFEQMLGHVLDYFRNQITGNK
jgi:GDP-4-dehydro-6-deoxy-D-mannose reductase